jgi:hypothetical protein
MSDNKGDASSRGKKPSDDKAPANLSTSRKPPTSNYFANYIAKGISREMEERKRTWHEDQLIEAAAGGHAEYCDTEINKAKVYSLAGDPHTHPPYHITSDDSRVRASGSLLRVAKRLRALLTEADGNHDGKVTYTEFAGAVHVIEPELSAQTLMLMAKGVDPDDTGRIVIEDAVAAFARRLATKPSQRTTLSSADPIAWAADDALADPGSRRQFVLEATETREHYSIGLPAPLRGGSSFGSLSASTVPQSPSWAHRATTANSSSERRVATASTEGARELLGTPRTTRATLLRDRMMKEQAEQQRKLIELTTMTRSGSARMRVPPLASPRKQHHGGLVLVPSPPKLKVASN